MYGFTQLKSLTKGSETNVSLEVSKVNGLFDLTVGENLEVQFIDGLLTLLGLDD